MWDLPKPKITWPELWSPFASLSCSDQCMIPFHHQRTWGMRADQLCRLCRGRGTMVHTLAGCKTAIGQGRYRCRHDKVLCALVNMLERERQKQCQTNVRPTSSIQLIREGGKPPPPKKTKMSVLSKQHNRGR